MRPKDILSQDFIIGTYPANLRSLPIIPFALEDQQKSLFKVKSTSLAAILFFKMRQKYSQARLYGYEYILQI